MVLNEVPLCANHHITSNRTTQRVITFEITRNYFEITRSFGRHNT